MLHQIKENEHKSSEDQSNSSENYDAYQANRRTEFETNPSSKIVPVYTSESTKGLNLSIKSKNATKNETFQNQKGIFENQVTQIQITWENITITAPAPKRMGRKRDPNIKDKVILDDISGTVKPGQFGAIIGPSGAGKTTLLNYLSGNNQGNNLKKSGKVYINGDDRNHIDYEQFVAYVQQEDELMQTMTVKECLMFAARMKLHPSRDIEKTVDQLIVNLKLQNVVNSLIGGPLVKGVSGGERKRTSIGVELITDPSLIFLDEPTTGLDSFTSENVIELLKELSNAGRTVIGTIHQPNSHIFNLFDQLMLMAQGLIIYHNSSDKAIDYFANIGYQCPEYANPADYFMDIMSIETGELNNSDDQPKLSGNKCELENNYHDKINYFGEKYEQSELQNNSKHIHSEVRSLREIYSVSYQANGFKQFWYIYLRALRNNYRIPITGYMQVIISSISAGILILVYGKLGNDDPSIQSRNGLLYFVGLINLFFSITSITLVFPDERSVYLREQANQQYKPTPYFFAKILSELPKMIVHTLIFYIVYFPIGLNSESIKQPLIYFFYSLLMVWACTGLGFMFSVMVTEKEAAMALVPLIMDLGMIVPGFFVSQKTMLPSVYPIKYLGPLKYSFQVYIYNEYDDLYLSGAPDGDYMESLGFDLNLEESVTMMAVIGITFYTIAYIILLCISRN